jgi:hypothetical protein
VVAVLSMSKQEFSRLDVLLRVRSGGPRVGDACVLIGLQRRQVFCLLRGLMQDEPATLLSKRRGRPSNHWLPAEVRTVASSIVRERYADFGPTPACAGAGFWWRRSYTRPRGGSALSISERSRSQIARSASAVALASRFCGRAFSHAR